MLTLQQVRIRLLEQVRGRIRNGDWTERSLARRAHLSQPHLHNLLQGKRQLGWEKADALMEAAAISMLDLVEPHELEALLNSGFVPDGWKGWHPG